MDPFAELGRDETTEFGRRAALTGELQHAERLTVEEAVGLLQQHGDDAKVIAGGHSLLPAMKLRLAQPGVLVDISKIASLKGIAINGNVTVGAGTTYRELASSADARVVRGRRTRGGRPI